MLNNTQSYQEKQKVIDYTNNLQVVLSRYAIYIRFVYLKLQKIFLSIDYLQRVSSIMKNQETDKTYPEGSLEHIKNLINISPQNSEFQGLSDRQNSPDQSKSQSPHRLQDQNLQNQQQTFPAPKKAQDLGWQIPSGYLDQQATHNSFLDSSFKQKQQTKKEKLTRIKKNPQNSQLPEVKKYIRKYDKDLNEKENKLLEQYNKKKQREKKLNQLKHKKIQNQINGMQLSHKNEQDNQSYMHKDDQQDGQQLQQLLSQSKLNQMQLQVVLKALKESATKDIDSVTTIIQESEQFSNTNNSQYSFALRLMGMILVSQKKIDKGLEYLIKGKQNYKKRTDYQPLHYGEFLHQIAKAYQQKEDYKNAKQYLNLSRDIYFHQCFYLQRSTLVPYVQVQYDYGLILFYQNKRKEAIEIFKEIRDLYQKEGYMQYDPKFFSSILHNLISLYLYQYNLEKASWYDLQKQKIDQKIEKMERDSRFDRGLYPQKPQRNNEPVMEKNDVSQLIRTAEKCLAFNKTVQAQEILIKVTDILDFHHLIYSSQYAHANYVLGKIDFSVQKYISSHNYLTKALQVFVKKDQMDMIQQLRAMLGYSQSLYMMGLIDIDQNKPKQARQFLSRAQQFIVRKKLLLPFYGRILQQIFELDLLLKNKEYACIWAEEIMNHQETTNQTSRREYVPKLITFSNLFMQMNNFQKAAKIIKKIGEPTQQIIETNPDSYLIFLQVSIKVLAHQELLRKAQKIMSKAEKHFDRCKLLYKTQQKNIFKLIKIYQLIENFYSVVGQQQLSMKYSGKIKQLQIFLQGKQSASIPKTLNQKTLMNQIEWQVEEISKKADIPQFQSYQEQKLIARLQPKKPPLQDEKSYKNHTKTYGYCCKLVQMAQIKLQDKQMQTTENLLSQLNSLCKQLQLQNTLVYAKKLRIQTKIANLSHNDQLEERLIKRSKEVCQNIRKELQQIEGYFFYNQKGYQKQNKSPLQSNQVQINAMQIWEQLEKPQKITSYSEQQEKQEKKVEQGQKEEKIEQINNSLKQPLFSILESPKVTQSKNKQNQLSKDPKMRIETMDKKPGCQKEQRPKKIENNSLEGQGQREKLQEDERENQFEKQDKALEWDELKYQLDQFPSNF